MKTKYPGIKAESVQLFHLTTGFLPPSASDFACVVSLILASIYGAHTLANFLAWYAHHNLTKYPVMGLNNVGVMLMSIALPKSATDRPFKLAMYFSSSPTRR